MTKTIHRTYISLLVLTEIAVLAYLIYKGYDYYKIPLEERPFSEVHKTLKPGGVLGHGYGIIGTLMMIVGVFGYMLRKRVKVMYRWGRIKYWLEFHIFLCTLGPILVVFHSAFKFGGLISISFWSMVAVVLSGVVGRFIYIQIPRTVEGKELDIEDINEMQEEIKHNIKENYNLKEDLYQKLVSLLDSKEQTPGVLATIFNFNFSERRKLFKIKSLLKKEISNEHFNEFIELIKKDISLNTKISHLSLMKKLFGYWHVIHLPFALIMLIIAIVHVGIAIAFGYTWKF